jgi:TRAP-type uncharacterized transport system substrate-binding protein
MPSSSPRLAILALALISVGLVACEDHPSELRIARPSFPGDRDIVSDLVELFDDDSRMSLALTDEGFSGEEALDAILAGDADIALVSNALPYRDGIATVIPLYPAVLHIAYTGDRDTTDRRAFLRDARVFAGDVGSASRLMFEQSLERTGSDTVEFEYVESITDSNMVVLFAPIAPDRMRAFPQVRLFSLGPVDSIGTGGSIDAATLLNPHLEPFIIPADTYGPVTPEPVLTLAVDKILVARRDLSPNSVYALVSELLRLRPALSAKRPGLFSSLSGDFDPGNSTFVLHSGAQAYVERDEPSVYERYSGIAEVAVTVLIAVFSATLGLMRLFRVRRKNRIDGYYAAVMDIRNAAIAATSDEERESMIGDVRHLQDKAFDELVNEKLAADESFRIFITLSNDVLRQLGGRDQLIAATED